MAKNRPGPIVRHRRKAAEEAAALGVITPVPDARRDEYGWPLLDAGQVLVTRTGTTYHTGRCDIVVDVLDDRPERLVVTMRDAVGARRRCLKCVAEDYA